VIQRLYVHNFRCLENFELRLAEHSSALLIGANGTGKSSVAFALSVLQKIARGTNRISDLLRPTDLTRGNAAVPMRFEIEVKLSGDLYTYRIALELPARFKEMRVLEEILEVNGSPIYTRRLADVRLMGSEDDSTAAFRLDWHVLALPIVQYQIPRDPLSVFKRWLASLMVLRPVPLLIGGDSTDETLYPEETVANFAAWFSGILSTAPAGYGRIESFLRQTMPDLSDIKNPVVAANARSLSVTFATQTGTFSLPFAELSDGEKCLIICSTVLAAAKVHEPLCCFWDEPDNYLALSEVSHFVLALRRTFQAHGGQLIATSHNPETIRSFSDETTFVFERRSRLEPATVRPLSEINYSGDLVGALIRGDVSA
jgi:predicted ATPase